MEDSTLSNVHRRLWAAHQRERKLRRMLQHANDLAGASEIEAALALCHQVGALVPTPPLSSPVTLQPTFSDWSSLPPGIVDEMNQLTLSPPVDHMHVGAPAPTESTPANDPYRWITNAGTKESNLTLL
jgi:hypothetical protein